MSVDSVDQANTSEQFSCDETSYEEATSTNHDLVELAQGSGSHLSAKELEYHFSELIKNLSAEVSKAKKHYAATQKDYQQTLVQLLAASRGEQNQFKTNYLKQLNDVITSLKQKMEQRVSESLESACVHKPSSSLAHQVLKMIKHPEIQNALMAKSVTDVETHFSSSKRKEPPFQSLMSEKGLRLSQLLASTGPTTIQGLESELTKLATTGSDRDLKVLAAAVLTEVTALAGKNLSLTTIEAWAYAAIIGKMTANSVYSTGFANLSDANKTLFRTVTGIDQFESNLPSHSFTTVETTEIAKAFSDGTIPLENTNDTKFMQAFYSNLQQGEEPKAAEANAYATVPRSSVSQATQVFITGVVNPNPPPFNAHTPTSIQDLESQLTKLGTTGPDRNIKALAAAVFNQVTALAGKNLSLRTIEAWAYAAIIGKMTTSSEYSTGFANLTDSEKSFFKTLVGIDAFESDLSSHSFKTAEATEIAKAFSDGTIPMQNTNDGKLMQAFYANLQKGQTPKTAESNAYATVPRSSVSQAMQTFMTGIVNPNPPPLIKSYPFTYVNNSGKSDDDIYIQIIGTNPNTNLQCFLQYDQSGYPSYVDAKKGLTSADYSYPLSYFANAANGSGRALNIPELNGGRVYTSIDQKVPISVAWAPKISQYLIIINENTSLVMDKTEFTINDAVDFNPTAVDDFSLPISVEATGKNGSTQKGGISSVSRKDIFSKMAQELKAAGDPWPKLMPTTPPVIYAPVDAANIGIFPEDYFQTIGFLDAFKQEFSTTPLQIDAGESFPNTGIFKGTYDLQTDEMTFTGSFEGEETSVVIKIPSTTSGLLNGGGTPWNINPGDPLDIKQLKAALARDIVVAIDTNTLTTTEALKKDYFIKNQPNFYKPNPALPPKLQFIDHYSKVLHSITRDIYTFGFDDEAGQSGNTNFPAQDFASGVITLAPLT